MIISKLIASGFIDDNDVTNFAKGFIQREEVLSQLLIQDFSWDAMDAHRARVGIIELVNQEALIQGTNEQITLPTIPDTNGKTFNTIISDCNEKKDIKDIDDLSSPKTKVKHASWKSMIVNDKAKLRRTKKQEDGVELPTKKETYNYGLSAATDDRNYQTLFEELEYFWSFMTVPQTSALAEPPIRERTAEIYCTHARLFLGKRVYYIYLHSINHYPIFTLAMCV